MTGLQLAVLGRAARRDNKFLPGTSMMFEQQAGRMRQMKRLLQMKLVRVQYGRLLATATGRKIYKFHMDGHGI